MKIFSLWVLIIISYSGCGQCPESEMAINHHRNVSTNSDRKKTGFVNILTRTLGEKMNNDGKYQLEKQIKSQMVVVPKISYKMREKRDSFGYPNVQLPNRSPLEVCHFPICFCLFTSPMFCQLIRKISKLAP